jgi:hypothetical protein
MNLAERYTMGLFIALSIFALGMLGYIAVILP